MKNLKIVTSTRKIVLRMAIVLGKGGVLTPYSWLARLGVGGKQGTGRQMFSWVHIEDLCRIVEWLMSIGSKRALLMPPLPAPGQITNSCACSAAYTKCQSAYPHLHGCLK